MFDVVHFINKFEKIPEELWCIGSFTGPYGRKCVMGHCGCREGGNDTREADALRKLFSDSDLYVSAVDVNDDYLYNDRDKIDAATPKQRILNALRYIQKNLERTN